MIVTAFYHFTVTINSGHILVGVVVLVVGVTIVLGIRSRRHR